MELIVIAIILLIFGAFWLLPRPRLSPQPPSSQVPDHLSPAELSQWLKEHESASGNVIDGAEASILWAADPEPTELCLLYVHGFSATRQETSPLCENLAAQLGANLVHARLAGHGLSEGAMEAPAEAWLQSMVDSWAIASKLGKQVAIIATSTGAPLTLWLCEQVAKPEQIHSLIFLSPNHRIRNPFGFLLTWPLAEKWVPKLLGSEHSWEAENEEAAKYWTNRYSVQAVIEMQKVVDWAKKHATRDHPIPLLTVYMEGDPTISHEAAISFHEDWRHERKQLVRVSVDDGNPQHVFAGRITAPHRVEWCTDQCLSFLHSVNTLSGTNPVD